MCDEVYVDFTENRKCNRVGDWNCKYRKADVRKISYHPVVPQLYNMYADLKYLVRIQILGSVPYVVSRSILLKVLDFWGRGWEVHIDIDFDTLEDNLHYCNKSRDIIMIVGFHLFNSLNVSFCSATPNLSPLYYHLDYVFFLGLWEHV